MESIKYYKLMSPYQEDETKNCKLTITDLDSNFLAFKDNDISGATFNDESKLLEIVRNNGESIKLDLSSLQENNADLSAITQHFFDLSGELSEDGVLTLKWEYSESGTSASSISISGFTQPIVETEEKDVVHTSTLHGYGENGLPLRISNNELTGYYKPALGIVEELPTWGLNRGDRYITKETVKECGYLYNSEALSAITSLLVEEESIWRIPTKADWDLMFNTLEPCDEDKNHIEEGDGITLGKYAAQLLKSSQKWQSEDLLDNYGFAALAVPSIRDNNDNVEQVSISYWTATSGYAKTIQDSTNGIYQDIPTQYEYCSIRLVADYQSNWLGFNAGILGDTYGIVQIPETNQIWINRNLSYDLQNNTCFLPTEDEYKTMEYYYINHWNGKLWEKKRLEMGDKISIVNANSIVDYCVSKNPMGEPILVKIMTIETNGNGNDKVYIDAGWY